jgi:hypothetical protein
LSLCLTKHYATKEYGGADAYIHVFLTSALVESEWSASRLGRFTARERARGIHWIGGYMDDMQKCKLMTPENEQQYK